MLVVGGVAVASGGASAQFDDSVDGFGGAVAGSDCVEGGQEGVLPRAQGSSRAISGMGHVGSRSTR